MKQKVYFRPGFALAIVLLCWMGQFVPNANANNRGQGEEEILFSGIGPHKRAVNIKPGKAKQFFDQGLNFYYAFNHGEAKRSFRAAIRHDPQSAMAWWGLALANGPHINNPEVAPEEEQEAVDALRKAMALIRTARPVDQALIRACRARYKVPQPSDRTSLNRAYAEAMRRVWKQYPNDDDVGALFAEAMMNLRPWDLWTKNYKPQPGTLEVVATLERVMKLNPKNPMGLHLYIHAVEASDKPERARVAADRLRDLQPALGHNVHMPSHIDVLVGDWRKAMVANQKAIEVDRNYRSRRPNQTIYRVYIAHNHHMLAFAAMMIGRRDKAIQTLDRMVAEIPEEFQAAAAPFVDGFFAMPIEARKRFGMWDEVLAMPDLPERFPMARAQRYAARSVSYAAKGMPAEARQEQAHFYEARKQVPADLTFGQSSAHKILKVAHHLMNGEILIAEGDEAGAVRELKKAVAAEDQLNYSEPPDWIQPARHTLGALLLKMGRYQEAEAVYRADLKKLPQNGWALYGLSESLKGQGKSAQAAETRRQFEKVWAGADLPITSSCLCLPNTGKAQAR